MLRGGEAVALKGSLAWSGEGAVDGSSGWSAADFDSPRRPGACLRAEREDVAAVRAGLLRRRHEACFGLPPEDRGPASDSAQQRGRALAFRAFRVHEPAARDGA